MPWYLGEAQIRAHPALQLGAWKVVVIGGLLITTFCLRTVISWRNLGDLDHSSGTWIALALDARDGTLYRPIVSDLGYGGTRYAPLHAVLQAGLLRCRIDPITSGYLIGMLSGALLIGATYKLMRRLDASPNTAALMTCCLLAGHCFAVGVTGIRGDLLAAALNLCGVAAVASGVIALAALFFVLAFTAKVTCVFGFVASMIWLGCNRNRRGAIRLATTWFIGVVLMTLTVQWASDGRAVPTFLACAGGGGQLLTLFLAPLAMLDNAIRYDPVALGFLFAALLLLPGNIRSASLPAVLLIVTGLGTIAIFGTPGTNINHLIDLHAAVLIFLATRSRAGRLVHFATSVPYALAAIAALLCLWQTQQILSEARGQTISATVADVGAASVGPVLSENPLIPILAGQRPYLLDAYMFRILSESDPSLAQQMAADVASQHFSSVVIYSRHSFGHAFMDDLARTYFLADRQGDYEIYFPRPR